MKDRIYICHTYYHVYVTFLKELKLRAEADPAKKAGAATLVLSKMSNNFENLKSRVESTGLFEEVLEFDEKREDFFPELEKYREDTGSFLGNLKNRIRFTKEYARLEASYVPVDLRTYKDIYVYCDSDPIGYYLNQNHIRYHAVEDGLNCLKNFDPLLCQLPVPAAGAALEVFPQYLRSGILPSFPEPCQILSDRSGSSSLPHPQTASGIPLHPWLMRYRSV